MDLSFNLEEKAEFIDNFLENYLKKQDPKTLYDAARHLPMAGGKRLRPFILMSSCNAVGGDEKKVMPLAVAIELIHNFTLIHDDIMDKSKLRRNLPTVHIKFGESTAIIAGDLLFTKAFGALNDIDIDSNAKKHITNGMVNCIEEICKGQQLDLEFEKRKIVKETEYIEMIRKKTAVLFMFAAEGGAIIGGGTKEEIKALQSYGNYLGLAFQIWDDYLDISSDEGTLGKDIGNDIRNGKKTLIAVHSLNNASGKNKKILDEKFGNIKATEKDVKTVFNIFKELDSVEYARNTALNYCSMAKQAIEIIKNSKEKQILIELADYSISREN